MLVEAPGRALLRLWLGLRHGSQLLLRFRVVVGKSTSIQAFATEVPKMHVFHTLEDNPFEPCCRPSVSAFHAAGASPKCLSKNPSRLGEPPQTNSTATGHPF
jgi:hypothetical protein